MSESSHLVDTLDATGTQTFPCDISERVVSGDTISVVRVIDSDAYVASGTAIWAGTVAEATYSTDAFSMTGPWVVAVAETAVAADVTNGVGPQVFAGAIVEAAYQSATFSVSLKAPWRMAVAETAPLIAVVAVPLVIQCEDYLTVTDSVSAS